MANNNNNNNVPNLVLSVSVCLLLVLLFHGSCLATQFQQQVQKCQLNRLEALEPDNSIVAEAGVIHTWNPNHEQFQCDGVALVKYVIEDKGFLLPSYSNAPQLIFFVLGRGILGVMLPAGCQKLLHIRYGEVIVIPAGVAFWLYGIKDKDQQVVAISLLHTGNQLNQLDPTPRRFYLAGNPADEFGPYRQSDQGQQQQSSSANNVFGGFDTQRLADSLKLNVDTIRKLQGDSNDQRKNIVRVDDKLGLDLDNLIKNRQRYSNQGSNQSERGDDDNDADNGSIDDNDINSCSVKLKAHIFADASREDLPFGGYVVTVNNSKIPILQHLQLSVDMGIMPPTNSSYAPHWNANAHSVIWAVHGYAQVQVVNDKGESVFEGEFRKGQALVVPKNYAVVKQVYSNIQEPFLWVSFKTSGNNEVKTRLAGVQNSFIGTLPEGVLRNIYNFSRDEIGNVKYNRRETTLLSTSS